MKRRRRAEPNERREVRLEDKAKILKEQRLLAAEKALELKVTGFSIQEIARQMELHSAEIPRLLLEGLKEYYADRDEELQKYAALHDARYDLIFRAYLPLARGYVEKVTDDDGDVIEIVHPPDPEATRIVLTAMRDAAKMRGLNKTRVEITGKDGDAIRIKAEQISGFSEEDCNRILRGDLTHIQSLVALSGGSTAANSHRAPSLGSARGFEERKTANR